MTERQNYFYSETWRALPRDEAVAKVCDHTMYLMATGGEVGRSIATAVEVTCSWARGKKLEALPELEFAAEAYEQITGRDPQAAVQLATVSSLKEKMGGLFVTGLMAGRDPEEWLRCILQVTLHLLHMNPGMLDAHDQRVH